MGPEVPKEAQGCVLGCLLLFFAWFFPLRIILSCTHVAPIIVSSLDILQCVYSLVDGHLSCSRWGSYECNCYEHSCTSLPLDLSFHFSWVNTLESHFWVLL